MLWQQVHCLFFYKRYHAQSGIRTLLAFGRNYHWLRPLGDHGRFSFKVIFNRFKAKLKILYLVLLTFKDSEVGKNNYKHKIAIIFQMLIVLASCDSGFLLCSILESFRTSFNSATQLHLDLFPYFLFPGQAIMMTASIFMTVAISMERYVVVHYPLNHKQAS